MRHVSGSSGRRYAVDDTELNNGGQARLYRCRDDKGLVRVYKEYRQPLRDRADIAQLTRIQQMGQVIVSRAEAARSFAETPESSVNWPIDLVGSGHEVSGVVLPLIPGDFMRPGGSPCTLDFLSLARANPPRASVRVGVLIRVCDIFTFLESARLLHGDVSAKNLVWRPSRSHAYLIDSDGIRSFSPAPVHGVCTPGWEDPRLEARKIPAHDRYSDRYALALALYRGLFLNPGGPQYVNNTWSKASGFPKHLDPGLRSMFARALDHPLATDGRPTAAQWRDALTSVYLDGHGDFRRPALDVLDAYAQGHRAAFTQPQPPVHTPPPAAAPALVPAGPPVRRPVHQHVPHAARPPVRRAAPNPPPAVRAAPPPPDSPWWWLVAALLIAVVGGSAYYLLHDQGEDGQGRGPSADAPPCPAEIAADMPDGSGSDAVLLRHYVTDRHDITLCRTADDAVYYHGGLLNRPDVPTITIPATRTDTGYRAPRGDYLYEIDGEYVRVTVPDGTKSSYRLKDVTESG
ncbi:hypothetical protein [Streptomyces sp. NBC_01565]|uniref:hypothetical protein n=1 Tax=unclassified Streptomyces TaxID=2593676 RepID=UPI00224CFD1C|nr:hypothetical protein [Streptomyces sp. NBC_01565]MCX4545520.1 hypothetical protein [Streptomyces sp. NBC_01565]